LQAAVRVGLSGARLPPLPPPSHYHPSTPNPSTPDLQPQPLSAGKSCQAQALRLGIARALVKFDPASHRALKQHALLKRDPRVVERKKPAQKKARKKRQWVKR